MDISRLFNDDDYRKRILSQVDDVSALEFWDDYQRWGAGDRQRVASPVVTRARKFYRNRTLQRIICQSRGLNFRWLIDTNKIFLASLTGVGEIEAHTLGALLITKYQLAVMSRTDTPEHQRQPVCLYIDEVQNFATHSLGTMFSQGRAFGLSLATANQHFSQLPGETLEAVLGNVGTNICFSVGENSARHLAGLMRPQFTTDDLQQLDKYTAVVKMQREGQTLPAFLLYTLPPLVLPDATTTIDRIRQHSRQTYGRPASEVDAELRRRYDPGESDEASPAPHQLAILNRPVQPALPLYPFEETLTLAKSGSDKKNRPTLERAVKQDRPPLRLTRRDLEIIQAVYLYWALTTPQIEALLFPPLTPGVPVGRKTKCRERLQKLFHHGFLWRGEIPRLMYVKCEKRPKRK